VTLTEADNGREAAVQCGDTVQVCLPENPTTGYRWAVDPAANESLSPAASEYARSAATGAGGGGTRCFTFRVDAPGTVSIRLTLRRGWQGDAAILKRFTATLHVSA
jgi:inhibitor of cysteine peptidase